MGEGGTTTKEKPSICSRFVSSCKGYCDLPNPFISFGSDAVYLPNACWKAKKERAKIVCEALLVADVVVIMFRA